MGQVGTDKRIERFPIPQRAPVFEPVRAPIRQPEPVPVRAPAQGPGRPAAQATTPAHQDGPKR